MMEKNRLFYEEIYNRLTADKGFQFKAKNIESSGEYDYVP